MVLYQKQWKRYQSKSPELTGTSSTLYMKSYVVDRRYFSLKKLMII